MAELFSTLSDRLSSVLDKLTGRGALSESDVAEAMREVRRALLEADVALDVVRDFIDKVKAKAVGIEVDQVGQARPDGRQDRPRRTGRHARLRRRSDQPRSAAAGADPDGRPAGLGQDHDGRQDRLSPDQTATRKKC